MPEQFDQKFALDRFRQWHFWWLVVFSFLLIITFVYYLPTRFLQQQVGAPHGHEEETVHEHDEGGMMTDERHQHMDEHMSGGMDMDEMMDHMMEMHGMEHKDAEHMMDDMMAHEHEEGANGHEHEETTTDDHGDDHVGVTYHEETAVKEGLAVNLNVGPVPYNVGVPLNLDFFVNMKPGNVPVLANQLQVEHEKLMHVVGLRSDMNEFFHIHPEFLADNPSVFSIDHTFRKPGLYKIWSDVKKDGEIHLYGHPEINVIGAGPREEKKVSFERNVVSGNYQVSLIADGTIVKNDETELTFDIHTLNGQEINVENYLGAQMHLVLIKDDWSQFIHTHPGGAGNSHNDDHGLKTLFNIAYAQGDGHTDHDHGDTAEPQAGDEVISFVAVFPEAGLYKAFAQFRPEGISLPTDEAITVGFWLEVKEKASFPVSQWWGLLLVSALLMAGLSWVVNNYLKVKPEDVTVKK